ncbi:MAG: 1-acyl-sn-glycerol-3-phosphate acyltransferase [Rhodococcus sp.]|nr:1-acyl-sn-glycerol-3-phosphate acyltransferase [Rhodococcus sp. (in: high G+C Gram-positive bacteria)]
MSHAWMPSSPCGERCLPTDHPHSHRGQVMLRWTALVLVLVASPALVLMRFLPPRSKEKVVRVGARILLNALGIRLETSGVDRLGDGELIVAGHVSWVDVLALAAVAPGSFVARGDLIEWRLLGTVARRMRVIALHRELLHSLPGVVGEVSKRLSAGERVVVFPEGTTWCGRAYGSFRPAMFQAAIDADRPVRPIGVEYRLADGSVTTGTSFIGEETIGQSIARIIRLRGITASLRIEALEYPGDCRRELARRSELAVRGGVIDLAARNLVDPSLERTAAAPLERTAAPLGRTAAAPLGRTTTASLVRAGIVDAKVA